MNATARKGKRDPERSEPYTSCAFCKSPAEGPFEICKHCGKPLTPLRPERKKPV
jgi:hypothetical protein